MADITLYHKQYNEGTRMDEWRHTQYKGVHWHGKQAVTVDANGLNTASAYTVRIITNDTIVVQNGDYIVLGLYDMEKPRDAETVFLVTAVSDNRKGSPALHHWRIEGK